MKTRQALGVAATLVLAGSLAACSGEEPANPNSDEPVTLTVMGLQPESKTEEREAFMAEVAAFEAEHPNITVEPSDYQFDSQTFAAMLAGGSVPTVLRVPFTESQTLIQRGQVQDITAEADELTDGPVIDDRVLALMSDAEGQLYGLPESAYAIGLLYNRDLFEQAGLDPDAPPETWDEVQEAAIALRDTVSVPYAELSVNGQGGWHLTMWTYSYGGDIEQQEGDEYVATFDDSATVESLEKLHELRWDDDVMGDQQLRRQPEALEGFAAGEIGMWLAAPDLFTGYVANFAGDPEAFGVAPMPQDGGDAVLTGGWVTMVSGTATDAERAAAVQWMDFKNLRPQYDPEAAARKAAADDSAGVPVGIPRLPLYDPETTDAVNDAIAEYVTFPEGNADSYLAGLDGLEYKAEPPVAGQEIYSALDTVMQSVLTDENANIDALLSDAMAQAEAAIRRAQ